MDRTACRLSIREWSAILGGVLLISALHYATAVHAVVLHEVFTRLYYLPIVYAATRAGTGVGLATAAMASALYLPHIILGWHASPAVQVGQYAEPVVFVLMAVVSGRMGIRLRDERNRAQEAGAELAGALRQLRSNVEDRIQLDRLATTGQLATGMAHELRNPLAAAQGALEIVERGTLSPARRGEFFEIARGGIGRASAVIQDFLDFAQPSPPSDDIVDVRDLVGYAARLTNGALTSGNVTLQTELPDRPVFACLDVEQVQRALVTLLLEIPQATEARRLKLSVSGSHDRVVVSLWFECRHLCREDVESLFEPFTDKRVGHGLSLALAKRFVENQAGTLQTDSIQNDTRIVMSFRASASTRRETPAEPGTHVEMVDALPGVADARLQVRARPDGGRSREGRAVLSRVETPS